jgi:hypothetical protein
MFHKFPGLSIFPEDETSGKISDPVNSGNICPRTPVHPRSPDIPPPPEEPTSVVYIGGKPTFLSTSTEEIHVPFTSKHYKCSFDVEHFGYPKPTPPSPGIHALHSTEVAVFPTLGIPAHLSPGVPAPDPSSYFSAHSSPEVLAPEYRYPEDTAPSNIEEAQPAGVKNKKRIKVRRGLIDLCERCKFTDIRTNKDDFLPVPKGHTKGRLLKIRPWLKNRECSVLSYEIAHYPNWDLVNRTALLLIPALVSLCDERGIVETSSRKLAAEAGVRINHIKPALSVLAIKGVSAFNKGNRSKSNLIIQLLSYTYKKEDDKSDYMFIFSNLHTSGAWKTLTNNSKYLYLILVSHSTRGVYVDYYEEELAEARKASKATLQGATYHEGFEESYNFFMVTGIKSDNAEKIQHYNVNKNDVIVDRYFNCTLETYISMLRELERFGLIKMFQGKSGLVVILPNYINKI